MADPSSYQIGGDHYRRQPIQHWDMVEETGLDYFLGCATKYLSRFHLKGTPRQDLEKAKHFLLRRGTPTAKDLWVYSLHHEIITKWVEGLDFSTEREVEPLIRAALSAIFLGDFEEAIWNIDQVLAAEPDSSYTNQS